MNVEKNSFAYTDIDVGKVELLHCLTKVRDAESLKQHPFFGSLSKNEWGQLVYKHLDHHLKQFSQ